MRVIPSNFGDLFYQDKDRLWLPLFQRRYCWSKQQLTTYYKDANTFAIEHRVGRIAVIARSDYNPSDTSEDAKNILYVVDGQQRCLTTVLLLTAIRAAAKTYLKMVKKQPDKLLNCNENVIKQLKLVKNKINSMLFLPSITSQGITRKELLKLSQSQRKEWLTKIGEGERVNFLKFLPSFYDRNAFYEAILLDQDLNALFHSGPSNEEFPHLIQQNKNHFEWLVYQQFFSSKSSKGSIDLSEAVIDLDRLTSFVLNKLTFSLLILTSDEDAQQLYQQLYFFGQANKLMCHQSRTGIDILQYDLAKNFLLSFFLNHMDTKETAGSQFYFNFWNKIENISPIGDDVDIFLGYFVDEFVKAPENEEYAKHHALEIEGREKERERELGGFVSSDQVPTALKWKYAPMTSCPQFGKFKFFVVDYISWKKEKLPTENIIEIIEIMLKYSENFNKNLPELRKKYNPLDMFKTNALFGKQNTPHSNDSSK